MASGDITRLIGLWQRGDVAAENALFEALYRKLHAIASQCIRSESPGRVGGATSLVHEAYLRFQRSESLQVNDSGHFLRLSARVMRRILVDKARARHSRKRGGDELQAEVSDAIVSNDSDADEILAVDLALEELSRHSPRQARLVELRYFAGFSEEELADALGISTRTVRREWEVARTRLQVAIDGQPRVF